PLGPPPGPAPEAVPGAPLALPDAPAPAPLAPGPAPGPLGLAPVPDGGAVPATPSAFGGTKSGDGPSVAVAQYNPRTGEYVGSDGKVYQVTNLVADEPLAKTWQDLLLH
ncbi:MAG: virulence factor mce family protein, partial [Mycobacterium sp.]|nr:virulence factor mce family protein [Mycobacterium sp.]